MTIRQVYAEPGTTLTSTAGSLASQVFSCNGLYDPNISAAGHQPSYFDTLGTIYNHYNVIASKCTFTYAAASTLSAPGTCVAYIEDNATVAPLSSTIAEQSTSSPMKVYTGPGQNPTIITLYWNANKFFGPNASTNTNLQGTTGTNPAEQSYFIAAWQVQGALTSAVYLTAEIEYTAVWRELKDITQS